MKKNSEYRKEALNALEGNWGNAVVAVIIYFALSGIVGASFSWPLSSYPYEIQLVSNISNLLILPLDFALTIGFLRLIRNQNFSIDKLFSYYNARVWVTMILVVIYEFLWTLLLIIPGIIKYYSYAMTKFILLDEPELKYDAAIEKSMEMMKGKKFKLFLLDLSFIGWALLCILTLGIGLVLLVPYMYSARAAFYEDLKAELAQKVEEEKENNSVENGYDRGTTDNYSKE